MASIEIEMTVTGLLNTPRWNFGMPGRVKKTKTEYEKKNEKVLKKVEEDKKKTERKV